MAAKAGFALDWGFALGGGGGGGDVAAALGGGGVGIWGCAVMMLVAGGVRRAPAKIFFFTGEQRSLDLLSHSPCTAISFRCCQANDIQLMVNRQARSTTVCYKSTNTGALVAEAGLRPATSLLDGGQRGFALRLAGLSGSGQARCVVGAKDAFGQQLERAL